MVVGQQSRGCGFLAPEPSAVAQHGQHPWTELELVTADLRQADRPQRHDQVVGVGRGVDERAQQIGPEAGCLAAPSASWSETTPRVAPRRVATVLARGSRTTVMIADPVARRTAEVTSALASSLLTAITTQSATSTSASASDFGVSPVAFDHDSSVVGRGAWER